MQARKLLFISLGLIFLASCSSSPSTKGNWHFPARALTQATKINGAVVPQNARIFNLEIEDYEDWKWGDFEAYFWTNRPARIAFFKKFNDPYIYFLKTSYHREIKEKPRLQKSDALYADYKHYFENKFVQTGIFKVGEGVKDGNFTREVGVFLGKGARKKATKRTLFADTEAGFKKIPGDWSYRGTGLPSFFRPISGRKGRYQIFSFYELKALPAADSDIEGFYPYFLGEKGELGSEKFGNALWLGVVKNSEGSYFRPYSERGKKLTDNLITGLFKKEVKYFYWKKWHKTSSFVGLNEKGGFDVFVPKLPHLNGFEVFSSNSSLEEAIQKMNAYVKVESDKYLARVAKEKKRQHMLDSTHENILMTLRLMGTRPSALQAKRAWESVYRQCKVFRHGDKKPEPCKVAYDRVNDIEGAIKAAKRAKYLKEEAEWKARIKKQAKDWDNFQKKMGISQKHGISGSSRMLHDQMLRNGYRWVRVKD